MPAPPFLWCAGHGAWASNPRRCQAPRRSEVCSSAGQALFGDRLAESSGPGAPCVFQGEAPFRGTRRDLTPDGPTCVRPGARSFRGDSQRPHARRPDVCAARGTLFSGGLAETSRPTARCVRRRKCSVRWTLAETPSAAAVFGRLDRLFPVP